MAVPCGAFSPLGQAQPHTRDSAGRENEVGTIHSVRLLRLRMAAADGGEALGSGHACGSWHREGAPHGGPTFL